VGGEEEFDYFSLKIEEEHEIITPSKQFRDPNQLIL
jgi:hypothetical protein